MKNDDDRAGNSPDRIGSGRNAAVRRVFLGLRACNPVASSAAAEAWRPRVSAKSENGNESGRARLMRLAGGHGRALAAACGLSAAAGLCGLVPFWGLYAILQASADGDSAAVVGWAGLSGAALLARHGCAALSTGIAHRVGFDILHDVRRALIAKMARLPLGFFLDRPAGRLTHVFHEQVEILELFFSHQLPDMAAALSTPLLCLGVLALLDWRLAAAALGILPLVWIGNVWMMRGHGPRIGQYFGLIRVINAEAVQFIQGMELARSFTAGGGLGARLTLAVETFRAFALDWQTRWLPGWSLYAVGAGASPLFVAPVGLWLYGRGELSAPALLAALLLSGLLGPPLQKVTIYGELYQRVLKAEATIAAILDAPEPPEPTALAAPVEEKGAFSVEFDNVVFNHGGKQALNGLSFTAPAGGVTALVGPSGAGKSTAIQLIGRFWDVDGGAVRIGGVDIRAMSPEKLNALTSFVFQDSALFTGSVLDNLRMGRPDADLAAVTAAAKAARCHDLIMSLPHGYDTPAGEGGMRFSGGERQRIAIARAILKDAPILALDEPTAFADPENEALIQQALADLMVGRTVIVVAHRLDNVVRADRIVVIDGGQAAAAGGHDALAETCPLYRDLIDRQAEVLRWRLPGHLSVAHKEA